jgi:putative hydrolase of HD superfamily
MADDHTGSGEEEDFALFVDRLKDVERQNPLSAGVRRERVAEHSWHVAIGVMLFHHIAPEPFDVGRAVQMALLHDLAEAYVGDAFAFGENIVGHNDREHAAMERLRAEKSSPAIQAIVDLWDEYEAQATPEARFVKAMDVYLPISLNHANMDESSWKAHTVAAEQVRRRLLGVRTTLGELAARCDAWIDDANEKGYLT